MNAREDCPVGATIPLVRMLEARKRIRDIASRTPLVYSPQLSQKTDCEVFLKLENFQPTKVFKIRGAANKLAQLPSNSSVVTASSGNHGFAVSYVARMMGQRATVCVPETANPDKIKNIKMFGANISIAGTSYEEAYAHARQIERETGAIFVHAYEDPDVVAGQGTVGIEIVEDLPGVDDVLVPVGDGGLISGIASAISATSPSARIIGVQSSNAPTMVHAFRTGEMSAPNLSTSIAGGLITKKASPVTLSIIKRSVSEMVSVDEGEIERATLELLTTEHLLVEPSGAASVAGLIRYRNWFRGRKVVAVISGGNISIQYLRQLLLSKE